MSRTRRDPRAERDAKSLPASARRRYDLGLSVSASGRTRRDPRGELEVITVRLDPRRRYDRTQTTALSTRPSARPDAAASKPAAPQIRIVETPAFFVLAVIEAPKTRLSRFDRQVLGAARLLADAGDGGGAVVALAPSGLAEIGTAGADRVVDLGADQHISTRGRMDALRSAFDTLSPRHVIFAEDGDSADLARRLAASLNEPILTDAVSLSAKQVARRKGGMRAEEFGPPPRLITLNEDRVAAYGGDPREARSINDAIEAPTATTSNGEKSPILSVETIPGDPSLLSLSETDFVVSAGNGVSDFDGFKQLAQTLSATPGASRVVCDAGLMPRAAQVGASGTVLAADCYLALGIAGAPQHLQGVAACEHVIAVNTDLHAAMVERAGLAIIQDAQQVMPALKAFLKERGVTR